LRLTALRLEVFVHAAILSGLDRRFTDLAHKRVSAADRRAYNQVFDDHWKTLPGRTRLMSESKAKAEINYETMPAGMAMDETDVNLRSYFSRMSEEKLAEYRPNWTDEQVIAWDDENFRDDGTLFLTCSERDVDIEEYRRVLAEHIRFRFANKAK
jgi:hypothetical protein